ncbi:unnamed protein product [Merluccius merluccius]
MTSQKPPTTPWSVQEVHTFLSLVADVRTQREVDGTTRNGNIHQDIAQLMATRGYHRTLQQCREKLRKMKSRYRAWRWFHQMDAIYGHRPAYKGREGGLDSATTWLQAVKEDEPTSDDSSRSPTSAPARSSTPQRVATGKRKRSLFQQDLGAVMRDIRADDVAQQEQNRAQRENHTQLLLTEAREAREQEASLRREENAQTAAFNQTLLGLLGQLVQAMSDRRT